MPTDSTCSALVSFADASHDAHTIWIYAWWLSYQMQLSRLLRRFYPKVSFLHTMLWTEERLAITIGKFSAKRKWKLLDFSMLKRRKNDPHELSCLARFPNWASLAILSQIVNANMKHTPCVFLMLIADNSNHLLRYSLAYAASCIQHGFQQKWLDGASLTAHAILQAPCPMEIS